MRGPLTGCPRTTHALTGPAPLCLMHCLIPPRRRRLRRSRPAGPGRSPARALSDPNLGRGDDAVGNPPRAQIARFELFELILLLKLDKQLPVEQFDASRAIRADSTSVSSSLPPLKFLLKEQHTVALLYIALET